MIKFMHKIKMDGCVVIESPGSAHLYETETSESVALSEALPNHDDSTDHVRAPPKPSLVELQVELTCAHSRIVKLESTLATDRQAVKRARIEEGDHVTSHVTLQKEELERMHKLEQERCKLLEELSASKAELDEANDEIEEVKAELKRTQSANETEVKQFRKEITELRDALNESQSTCTALKLELDSTRLQTLSATTQQLDSLTEAHLKKVESLTAEVRACEELKSALSSSQAQVRTLERQLKTLRQDSHLVETVRERLLLCDTLERKVVLLEEENQALAGNRDNLHLLRYKVESLSQRCERVQGLEETVARLTLENTQLREQLEGAGPEGGASAALLQYRVAALQNNEKIFVAKKGELEAKLHAAEVESTETRQVLENVKAQLSREQLESRTKDEKVQRLEKRLLFVTKEREGCMNVLNSYSRDSGVDELLRHNVTELESQLTRANARIAELEAGLEAP